VMAGGVGGGGELQTRKLGGSSLGGLYNFFDIGFAPGQIVRAVNQQSQGRRYGGVSRVAPRGVRRGVREQPDAQSQRGDRDGDARRSFELGFKSHLPLVTAAQGDQPRAGHDVSQQSRDHADGQ